jgi:glycosyltransferase involved in cell wall biosynthesis
LRSNGRVLLVTPQPFFENRGSSIAARHVLTALGELGYAVDLIAFPMGDESAVPGVRITRTANPIGFSSVPVGFSWRKAFLDLFLLRTLASTLRRERYQCVHALEEAAFLAAPVCRRRGVPLIYDMQSSIPEQLGSRWPFRSRWVQRALRNIERRTIQSADHVVCSQGLAQRVHALAPGHPVAEWRFPASSPDPEPGAAEALRSSLGIDGEARVFLYAGTFAGYQGLDVLVRAIPQVVDAAPEAVFVLVGATPLESRQIMGQLTARARSATRILERRPWSEIPRFLALADFVVSMRERGGNAPLKVFDYMASRKPILASRVPAHEVILNDEIAVLFEHTTVGFVEAALALLQDPQRAARIAGAAREFVLQARSWERFVEHLGQIYARVVRVPGV